MSEATEITDMKDFALDNPGKFTAKWCNSLITNLQTSFTDINASFKCIHSTFVAFKENVKTETDLLSELLSQQIKEVKAEAASAKAIAEKCRSEVAELKTICLDLKQQNIELKEQNNNLETYSRKNNIIIRGLHEPKDESNEQCETSVKLFLKNKLKIDSAKVESIKFNRCHRLKPRNKKATRDVIIRFHSLYDRDQVWSKKSALYGQKFGMSEDFPRSVASNRRRLFPIFNHARRVLQQKNVSLKGDKLIIAGSPYTVTSLDRLPEKLHPRNFNEKSNETTMVFGGILSEWHPFSNWSPCSLRYKNINFKTLEHAYMHTMAKTFKDDTIATEIIKAPDAQSAKILSYSIKDFNPDMWNEKKADVMKTLLKIKFVRNSTHADKLLKTGNKRLAETGRGSYYSCGMSITDSDVLDTSKWSGNNLGLMLQSIRNELRA